MTKRIVWVDALRVFSCFLIILLHVMGNTLNTFYLEGTPKDIYTIFIKILAFAVPVFMMLSGYMLLNPSKKITTKEMLKKYVFKTLLIIIIYGLFFVLLEYLYMKIPFTLNNIGNIFVRILNGDTWDHMWYLYLLFGMYLVTPILKIIVGNISDKDYQYLLIIMFLFIFIIPEVTRLLNINIGFYIPFTNAFLFYFLYGYYIGSKKVPKEYKIISYILGTIAIIIIIVFSKSPLLITSYESLITCIIANAIFLLYKSMKIPDKLAKPLTTLSSCSLGVYLLHQFYINLIFKFFKINFILNIPYTGLFIYAIIIYLLTFITVYLLKKIQILEKIL